MMKQLSRLVVVLGMLAPLAACETAPPPQVLPELTFENLKPIALSVARVEVKNAYISPLSGTHVEASAPVSPTTALKAWAAQRLKAVGGAVVARLVIKTASLTATPLKLSKGIQGVFTDQQSVRYDITVKAELLVDDGGMNTGSVIAEASRSRTVPETATIDDRRRAQFELVEGVMADFDKAMVANMRIHLKHWMPKGY